MDEDEIIEVANIRPQRHDRWSVLVYGLNYISAIAAVTSATFSNMTDAAMQHAAQMDIDRRFHQITKGE